MAGAGSWLDTVGPIGCGSRKPPIGNIRLDAIKYEALRASFALTGLQPDDSRLRLPHKHREGCLRQTQMAAEAKGARCDHS